MDHDRPCPGVERRHAAYWPGDLPVAATPARHKCPPHQALQRRRHFGIAWGEAQDGCSPRQVGPWIAGAGVPPVDPRRDATVRDEDVHWVKVEVKQSVRSTSGGTQAI